MGQHASTGAAISVVVPFHDEVANLPACIESLRRQVDVPGSYEIVLVDNNSTDGSRELAGRTPQVRLLTEKRPGSYAARNRAVAETNGEYIAFIDADCAADPLWLAGLMAALRRPGAVLAQGGRTFGGDSMLLATLAAYEAERADFVFAGGDPEIAFGYTNNMALRREVVRRCGPFAEVARGADSIFVQQVMETYGPGAVVYARDARIRHLEIRTVADFLRKKILYGRSAWQNHGEGQLRHRDLTRAESLELLWRTRRRQDYSAARTGLLALVLWVARRFFTFGRKDARRRARRAARMQLGDQRTTP